MSTRWMRSAWFRHAALQTDVISDCRKTSASTGLLTRDDEDSMNFDPEDVNIIHQQRSYSYSFCIGAICSLSVCAGFIIALIIVHQEKQGDCQPCYVTDEKCSQHMSASSPLIHEGVVRYEWEMYNGLFDAPSLYRGTPTRERDQRWRELENRQVVGIEPIYLQHLNKTENKDSYLKAPPEFGDLYAGYLEVHHQLHCLNSLRQYTYKDFYLANMDELPSVFRGSPTIVRMHLDHCIEMLRINLMCTADVTPILMKLDPSMPKGVTPDFSTKHKCRRLDDIVSWENEHSLPI